MTACDFFLIEMKNYTDVCASLITCFSILTGLSFAYILYWQTNNYLKKREALDNYNKLGDKLTLFRKLICHYFNSDPWINQRAISDYKYHSKVRNEDQMLEDIADNPFLNFYIAAESIYDNIINNIHDSNYTPEYSLREIRNLQTKANTLWYFVSERRDSNADISDLVDLNTHVGIDDDFKQECLYQLAKRKFEKIDKYTIAHIAGNIECDIIPKMEQSAKLVENKNPKQIKVIVYMLLVSFIISVLVPIFFLVFEVSSLWVYLLLVILVAIPIWITVCQIRSFITEEVKIKKGNHQC